MSNFEGLSNTLKEITNSSMEMSKPTHIMYGKVVSLSPIEINVEQRMILTKQFLTMTERISKDSPLRLNDKVVLLRESGGQKFLIIDKVVSL